MNMSLTRPAYYKGIDWPDSRHWVTIHNTSNESLNLLRPEMIIPTLETVKRNVNRKQEDLRLFEFGKSYKKRDKAYQEDEWLTVFMTGKKNEESWLSDNKREKSL